jgi:nicotinamide-nucleotide amidase
LKACILAIGSEMLTPFRVDTNSLFITERLNAIGYDVRLKAVVGDDVDELADVLRAAIAWADLIVITGGLGPTEDDVTRDAVARVYDMPLDVDEAIADRIRDRFARRGMTMPEINRRQAMVPRGAVVLENPNGTAPGLWIERGRTAMVLLPGPPREMKPMLEGVVARPPGVPVGNRVSLSVACSRSPAARIGRRRSRPADVREMDIRSHSDQHHDSGGSRGRSNCT